jgi:dipeptidyl aminopeptidase/acylaminoacyl peptidase
MTGLVGIDGAAGGRRCGVATTEASSDLNTNGSVRPPRSRMMTTTRRLPVWFSARRRSLRSTRRLAGANVAAEIRAVYFDLTRDSRALGFRSENFADFVSHDESRLVLAIQVAAQLQGAMTLHAVDENRNRQEVARIESLRLAKMVPLVTLNW